MPVFLPAVVHRRPVLRRRTTSPPTSRSYNELGATVVGVSGDDIATQVKFSTLECRSKFLVAADPGLKIAKSYDAAILGLYANRTSYVIAQNGTIAYAYTSLDPDKHVANTLAALRALKRAPG